jgi:uncharacterized protein (DUF2249 family)/mannose-6-phosphate isomerase-like protein (cupin superfamily)
MQIHKLRELVEFDDKRFSPRVLMNRPGYRLVQLNLRRGQGIPEHATKEMVTVYAISGHITFYEAQSPFELHAGEVLFIEGGVPHALEAHEDSTLLVVAAGNSVPVVNPELDLRAVPHSNRHPLVFARFDALAVGESFELVNDHDPTPLYRQMDAMRPGQAVWSYLDRGPEVFRIRVLRIAPLSGPAISTPAQPEALLGIQR